jgi:phosphoglycerol transferase MdoB-like AlkP superfamily enzyme
MTVVVELLVNKEKENKIKRKQENGFLFFSLFFLAIVVVLSILFNFQILLLSTIPLFQLFIILCVEMIVVLFILMDYRSVKRSILVV